MTAITKTRLARAIWRDGAKNSQGRVIPRIVGYHPPQPRSKVYCKCGRFKLLSVGQIYICHHKD